MQAAQPLTQLREPLPPAGTEEAIVADLDPPLGQDVLQEAPDELLGG